MEDIAEIIKEKIENFNWEVTPHFEDDIQSKLKDFKMFKLDKFKHLLNNLKPTETNERTELIINFYDNIENDIWNEMFSNSFKTKIEKSLNKNFNRNVSLLDYQIVKDSNKCLNEERFKTANIEKYNSWKIAEDKTFADYKPEILDFIGVEFYQVRAKVLKEIYIIPFSTIFDTLKQMEQTYIGILEYIFNKVLLEKNLKPLTQKEIRKDGLQLLKDQFEIALYALTYREHIEFGNISVWNGVVKNKVEIKDIGFFSLDKITHILGNVWIDPDFRGQGITTKIFDYLIKKHLPDLTYIFVQTKNPVMEKLIRKQHTWNQDDGGITVSEIGRSICYESGAFPFTTSEKENLAYNEKLFVIHSLETMEMKKKIVEYWLYDEKFIITKDFYPTILLHNEIKGEYSSNELYQLLTWKKPSKDDKMIVLNYTKDKNILPFYNDSNENIKIQYPGKIIKIDDSFYFLPMPDNQVYIPHSLDIRNELKRIDNSYEIHETENDFIVIVDKAHKPEIFYYNKNHFKDLTLEILYWLFEKRNLGAENIIDPIKNQCNETSIDYKTLTISFIIDNLVTKKDIIKYYNEVNIL